MSLIDIRKFSIRLSIFLLLFSISSPVIAQETYTQSDYKAIVGSQIFFDEEGCSATAGAGGTSGAAPGSVFLLGDSIMDVDWPNSGNDDLINKMNGGGWSVEIAANAGWSVTQWLSSIDTEPGVSEGLTNADYIVIELGANPDSGVFNADSQTVVGDFTTKIESLIAKVKELNNTAKIFWVDVGSHGNGTAKDGSTIGSNLLLVNSGAYLLYSHVNEKIYANSSSLGYSVIPWFNTIFPDGDPKNIDPALNDSANYLSNDKLHPTADGADALATVISNTVKSGGSGATSTPTVSNSSVDPAALEYFNTTMKPLIDPLIPLYQESARREGIPDWEILPALHNLEYGLKRDNPTTNVGFRTPYQMSITGLTAAGANINDQMWQPGYTMTDEEFIVAGQYAINTYLQYGAQVLDITMEDGLTPEEAGKLVAAYKSGPGSAWFTGGADFNLHAYAWAGFDTTPEHKLPMAWGPGSIYADEVAGTTVSKPGAATVFVILKGGSFSATPTCGSDGQVQASGGTLEPVTGTREELVDRLLNSENLQLGNYGDATTQRSDIETVISDKLLAAMVAMVEQSGAKLYVNAIKTDHSCGTSLHCLGQAVDIGYFGVGNGNNNEEGNKMFKFLHDNYSALGGDELIWWQTPDGTNCAKGDNITDCQSIYDQGVLDQHDNHIHFATGE